jgi:DNA-binding response OmpR family regulator
LQQGAVVYLRKPIDVYEMMAYIDRYAHDWKPSVLHIGLLELSVESRILTYRGKEVKRLTRLEYGILALLYENRGKVVSYTDFSELWEDGIMSEASLQNYISRLRKALADDSAVSLDSSGKGYVLVFD